MVLMQATGYLLPPHRGPSYFGGVRVAFDNKHVTILQSESSSLLICASQILDLAQVERAALNVGDT